MIRFLADECCPKAVVDRLPAAGVVILFLPKLDPTARAERLAAILGDSSFEAEGRLTIIEARRLRQRSLTAP